MTTPTEQSPPQDWKPDTEVVSWNLARSHLGVAIKHAYALTLADGQTVYGCAYCPLVTATWQGITVAHLFNSHGILGRGKRAKAAAEGIGLAVRKQVEDMPLSEVITLAAANRLAEESVEEWRRRALAAEKRLRDLRRALAE